MLQRIQLLLWAAVGHVCNLSGIFGHVQKVNCPKGAREATLGCAAAKNDFDFICRCGGKLCEAFVREI